MKIVNLWNNHFDLLFLKLNIMIENDHHIKYDLEESIMMLKK
jgi:hypothetical protein